MVVATRYSCSCKIMKHLKATIAANQCSSLIVSFVEEFWKAWAATTKYHHIYKVCFSKTIDYLWTAIG